MKTISDYQVYRPTTLNKAVQPKVKSTSQSVSKGSSFLNQLQNQLHPGTSQDLKISKHAEQRMQERQITLSPERLATINQKLTEAKSMGVTDSLVLTDKEAFVCSATNKTVITAMNRDEAAKQIFTNINGTIILN